ncbi:MAG: polysaccharide biosynthesis C-terminal domain-containing protein [Planctomycetales bacterium]|nr:polysaccharide biosynthesis C-terminal domain-containing protein [Planctomycetales bacterium]
MSLAAINSIRTASKIKSFGIGNNVWALADQVLISGTNFVSMILLARGLDSASTFGTFVLVHSILLFSNSIQSALVTQPHNVLGVSRQGADYVRYTSSSAVSQLAITFGFTSLVAIAWVTSLFLDWGVAPLLLAMVPVVLAWQLQEFMRRVLYTEGRTSMAFAIDVIAYGGQTAAITAFWWRGDLSGSLALYSIAVASALAAMVGLWQLRQSLDWQFDWNVTKENWHFGKWLAGGYIVGNWFSSQLLVFLAAALLGTWAAGILRAIHTIFGPLRILAQAFSTTLPIRLAGTLENSGPLAFRRDVGYAFLVATPLLGGYCLLVGLLSGHILTFAFGEKYSGHEYVLMLSSAAAFVGYHCIIFSATLRATRRTRQIFMCELCATCVVVPLSAFLIPWLGIYGVVLGMMFTDVLLLTLFYWSYRATLAEIESMQPAIMTNDVEHDPQADERSNDNPSVLSQPMEEVAAGRSGQGELLLQVFEALDRAQVRYCVLHGYEQYPEHVPSDVDCIMPTSALPGQLYSVLTEQLGSGIEIVQWIRGGAHGIVLRRRGKVSEFLLLDISDGCHLNKRLQFLSGEEILRDRKRSRGFWIPATKVEFACYLIRKIVKKQLNREHAQRLSQLYRADPQGCQEQIERFFGRRSREQIAKAATAGDWSAVRAVLATLRRELIRRAALRQPLQVIVNLGAGFNRRIGRWFTPGGFHIALLGPDGAGKSSVAHEVQRALSPVFLGTMCRSFPPKLLNRQVGNPSQPHLIPPRSKLGSIVRAILYWWTYYSPGYYFTIYPALVHSSLVIHDRHVIDCIVDPTRYRYSGPARLLNWIWRWMPKPELVILLDVPAEIVQMRKQEVTFDVSARQRLAYRELVAQLPNGRIVDGSQPLATVVAEVSEMILKALSSRLHHESKSHRFHDQ